MSIEGLNRLKVWGRAKDFALTIYKRVLPLLPPEEKWNLNQQLRRASLSVSANIAEGYGRFYYQDNVRFCYNARGSLEEVLSHLTFASERTFFPRNSTRNLQTKVMKLSRCSMDISLISRRASEAQRNPEQITLLTKKPWTMPSSLMQTP
jgi:four helix bundle protein